MIVLTSTPYKIELKESDQLKRTMRCSNPYDLWLKNNTTKQKTQKALCEAKITTTKSYASMSTTAI